MERTCGHPGLKVLLMGAALIPSASWALFVLHSSVLKQYSQSGVSIVSLAKLTIIVDHFIGVESIRWIVSKIILENVEK